MVFGIDDIIEGFTLADVALFLSSLLFPAAESSVVEGSSVVITNLLGEDGLTAVVDLAKNEAITEISPEIGLEFEKDGARLWLEEGETFIGKNISREGFIDRVKLIGSKLKNAGIDVNSLSGKNLLNNIVKKSLELGKKGISKVSNPKLILSSVIGGLGGGSLIKAFEKRAKKDLRNISTIEKPIDEIKRF